MLPPPSTPTAWPQQPDNSDGITNNNYSPHVTSGRAGWKLRPPPLESAGLRAPGIMASARNQLGRPWGAGRAGRAEPCRAAPSLRMAARLQSMADRSGPAGRVLQTAGTAHLPKMSFDSQA